MKYQLVIQFPHDGSLEHFNAVIELERRLATLSTLYVCDGHDAGKGEMNIFLHTDEPLAAFDIVRSHIPGNLTWRAGFRAFDDEEYTPLYPSELVLFEIA